MSQNLLRNIKFRNEIRRFFEKYKEKIIDIILFGSAVRGKEKPGDIDILILFKSREERDIAYELRKNLERIGIKAEIIIKNYRNFLSPKFLPREDLLSDGYSLHLNKNISEGFGYKSFVLFKYSLKKFSKSQRIRFFYALEGRKNKEGIIKTLDGIKFTSAVVLIPVEHSEEFKSFLLSWNVDFKQTKILIPERTIRFIKF